MAVPVLADTLYGRILAALAVRVRAISIANGYPFDVKPDSVVIDPEPPMEVVPSDLPWFLLTFAVEKTSERRQWHHAGEIEDHFPVEVFGRFFTSGSTVTPDQKMALALAGAASLEKALIRDAITQEEDITLGGLCVDIRVDVPEPALPQFKNDPNAYVVNRVVCHYFRQYGQP